MLKQKNLIKKREWDYLFVLDACRFDYFQRTFDDYLDEGNLSKVISPATHTTIWCKKIFGGRRKNDDIVYVSGNPYINSKVPIGKLDARGYFYKLVDVWDSGWNEEKNTVFPQEVIKGVKKAMIKYPGKRIIAHFMQPHAPYLTLDNTTSGSKPEFNIDNQTDNNFFYFLRRKMRNFAAKVIRLIGQRKTWRLREELGIMEPSGPIYEVLNQHGEKELKRAYQKNLETVLEGISGLIENLSGKIIITSDHGELLGEGNNYGHYINGTENELFHVPWLEIKK
ncbi:hypothetical protein AKJ52_01150 [candidate division MSBL1 archaeon SCGC-AAA382C18]|uniref:Sulfatase N-terminal domain-containing protein n=1 Tax=candidate division MSBL1 archaeon SCGC-AAA382C18 TaxID=1698281 RepID=A0A133VKR8_9EURY|nr:hypothetical protein AKJ52_01150 [candidate division MSBL1 archaeon SCGC-AAA382C18]